MLGEDATSIRLVHRPGLGGGRDERFMTATIDAALPTAESTVHTQRPAAFSTAAQRAETIARPSDHRQRYPRPDRVRRVGPARNSPSSTEQFEDFPFHSWL